MIFQNFNVFKHYETSTSKGHILITTLIKSKSMYFLNTSNQALSEYIFYYVLR